MRRLAGIAIMLAGAGLLAALLLGASAQGSSTARFDVIFDDARGLVSGQLVKIAGANAGTIENVIVTPDYKARIEATVSSQFMPFHQDAHCTIRPEGLIAENYVDCDPGTANTPPLKPSGGHPPTVPVTNTTEPVSLLDLFNIFNLPTRDRFMVLIDELGIGTAGRGGDFNDILRRANPALALARQAISILNRQRNQLATLVDATSTIASEGAGHTAILQNFLDRAAAVTTITSDHSSSLALAINRLPALLAAAQPALQQLDTVARDGTPLLAQIYTAVPYLNRVSADLPPFTTVAKPALAKLSTALRKTIPAIQQVTPLVKTLRTYADRSRSGTLLFARLSTNLQQHGFVENFLSVTYYIAASLARFDSTSHLLPILLVGADNGMCGNYSTTPIPACSAHYGQHPAYKPSTGLAQEAQSTGTFGDTGQGSSQGAGPAPQESQASLNTTALGPLTGPQRKLADQLVSQLLHNSGHLTKTALAELRAVLQSAGGSDNTQTMRNLIGYLLK